MRIHDVYIYIYISRKIKRGRRKTFWAFDEPCISLRLYASVTRNGKFLRHVPAFFFFFFFFFFAVFFFYYYFSLLFDLLRLFFLSPSFSRRDEWGEEWSGSESDTLKALEVTRGKYARALRFDFIENYQPSKNLGRSKIYISIRLNSFRWSEMEI